MAQRGRPRRIPANPPEKVETKQEAPENKGETMAIEPKAGFVALGCCRYSNSEGVAITAQPGDFLIDPNSKDLEELIGMSLVEEFDTDTVAALKYAMQKSPVAVRKILGL